MIPKIHIALLRAKGQTEGKLDFSFDGEQDWLDLPLVSFSSPVSCELFYEIAENGEVAVRAHLRFGLKGSCSRCLEPAEEEIFSEAEALFVPGEADEDEGEIPYRGGCVEPDGWLRECVIFAIPPVLHCAACKQEDNNK